MNLFRLYIIVIILISWGCSGNNNQVPADVVSIPNTASGDGNPDKLPVIEFSSLEHDFGNVIQGEIVSYGFKFKNTGKADLVIANISAACGCTASEYPRTPVKPGAEDVIEVIFNSSGKQGFQNKTLTIAANTQPNTTVLTIKALVFIPERQ